MGLNYLKILLLLVVLCSGTTFSTPIRETPDQLEENAQKNSSRKSKTMLLHGDDFDDLVIAPQETPVQKLTQPQMAIPPGRRNSMQYVPIQHYYPQMEERGVNYVPVAMIPVQVAQTDSEGSDDNGDISVIPIGVAAGDEGVFGAPSQEKPLEAGETLVTANTMTFRPVFSIRRTYGQRRRVYGYGGSGSYYPVQRYPLYGGQDGFPTVA